MIYLKFYTLRVFNFWAIFNVFENVEVQDQGRSQHRQAAVYPLLINGYLCYLFDA